jgi:hypothetical protein
MAVKVDLEELKESLSDLGLPGEELEELESAIKSRGYHVRAVWLVRYLRGRGFGRGRCVEFLRGLGVEDEAIAAVMERAMVDEGEEVRIRLGGRGERRSPAERLAVFRDEEPPAEEDDEALRGLHRAVKGGGERD